MAWWMKLGTTQHTLSIPFPPWVTVRVYNFFVTFLIRYPHLLYDIPFRVVLYYSIYLQIHHDDAGRDRCPVCQRCF